MDQAYRYEPVTANDSTIRDLLKLFVSASGGTILTADVLKWQYEQNPDGKAVGVNAYAGDQLAAHMVMLPIKAWISGKRTKGLLSINTATHPDHQKRGLFVTLAELAFQHGQEQGYEFVIGAANQNSVHGFVRKLGFQHLGQLERRFVLSPIAQGDHTQMAFSRLWDRDTIAWRLANPLQHYMVRKRGSYAQIIGRSARFPALVGQVAADDVPQTATPATPWPRICQWIGIDPTIDWGRSISLSVPERFRPIPLNLIYRNLVDGSQLDPKNVRFWAMDFDAY